MVHLETSRCHPLARLALVFLMLEDGVTIPGLVALAASLTSIECRPCVRTCASHKGMQGGTAVVLTTGGPSPRFGYATPPLPPPPSPCPPGPLSYQGSIATGHTYGSAEGARKFFSFPLPT